MSTKPVRSEEKKHRAGSLIDIRTSLRSSNPNILKDRLYKFLIGMTEIDRSAFCKKLFTALTAAGVNIHNHMLLLGCNANQPLDATANDVALLIRYYRINLPNLLDVLATVIEQNNPEVTSHFSDLQTQERAA